MVRANTKVSVADILVFMKFEGTYGQVSTEVKRRKATADAARQAGLRVRTVELQKAADLYRLQKGLFRAADTEEWLISNGLTHEDFESHLEVNELIRKFMGALERKANAKRPALPRGVKSKARQRVYEKWLRKAVGQ